MLKTMVEPAALPAEKDTLSLFDEKQLGWRDKARSFASAIPINEVLASDSDNKFRRDLFQSACQLGLGALPFPSTYGGSGGDYVSFCLVNEEFGRSCTPIMSSLGVHVLCQEPVYRFGNEEQKQKYLVPSATGKYLAAFGLTEPGAGSDTAALSTSARLDGEHYILNGTKTFITSGASADFFIVMARLKDEGITSFIVEKGFPGFQIGQKFDMIGMRGYSTCEIVFNDCQVPRANLLGAHGAGRKVALSSLGKGRVTIAAQATGWAQGSLEAVIKVTKERRDAGRLSADELQSLSNAIGDLAVKVESARVLTYQAAHAIDRGEADVTLAGMAKIQASDVAMHVSTEAMSLCGDVGMQPELLIERIFRDAKAGQIYEGTNQIQRMLIARNLVQ
jgi:alkylation response protein AidB-like acyl-CoA dehydrogenase